MWAAQTGKEAACNNGEGQGRFWVLRFCLCARVSLTDLPSNMPQYLNKLTEHENYWQNLGGPRLFRLREICLSVPREWCTGKALLFIAVKYHQSPTAVSGIKYKLVSEFYNSASLNQISWSWTAARCYTLSSEVQKTFQFVWCQNAA